MAKGKVRKTSVDENEMFELIEQHFHGIKNIDLIILKGHLLVEYAMSRYIDVISNHDTSIDSLRFGFFQKLELCKILGFIDVTNQKDLEIYDQLKILNEIRNKIAHSLSFDRKMLDGLFKYHLDELEEYKRYKEANRDREILKGIIPWLFGALSRLMAQRETKAAALKAIQEINAEMKAATHYIDHLWKTAVLDS